MEVSSKLNVGTEFKINLKTHCVVKDAKYNPLMIMGGSAGKNFKTKAKTVNLKKQDFTFIR